MADEAKAAETSSTPTALDPEGAHGFKVPGDPKLPACPTCKTGVLYTIAYDPDALHEAQPRAAEGDPTAHVNFTPSGGSIRLQCFNCGMSQTQPLKPGKTS